MKKIISLIFKSLIVILSLTGIIIQVNGNNGFKTLNYYTLISNLICAIYFIIDIIMNIKKKEIYTFCPLVKSIVTMGITVTFLVVIFILGDIFPTTGIEGLSFLFLHYIVPIMVIIDWIIFDQANQYKIYYPFTNLILPVIYYFYVVILSHTGYLFLDNKRYPYDFINVDINGLKKVILTNIGVCIFFIVLGFIFYFIDTKIKKNKTI